MNRDFDHQLMQTRSTHTKYLYFSRNKCSTTKLCTLDSLKKTDVNHPIPISKKYHVGCYKETGLQQDYSAADFRTVERILHSLLSIPRNLFSLLFLWRLATGTNSEQQPNILGALLSESCLEVIKMT